MAPAPTDPLPLKVFISYSHQDEPWREKLHRQLSLLEKQGILQIWHDRCLQGGEDWSQRIDRELQDADLVLLLISSDFIFSNYAFGLEMNTALARQETGQCVVVPILLRHCDWHSAPFAVRQALPRDDHPIADHPRGEDGALREVAEELRRLATGILEARAAAGATPSRGTDAVPILRPLPWWQRHRRALRIGLAAVGMALVGLGGASVWISRSETARGQRYLRLGAYALAQPHFAAALRWNPISGEARRGVGLASLGELLPSLEEQETTFSLELDRLKRKWPEDPLLQVFSGDRAFEIFRREGDPALLQQAMDSYRAAAEKDGNLAIAQARLGFLHDLFGDYSAAESAWRRGLDLARSDLRLAAPYRGGLARVLAQQGKLDEALKFYDGDPQGPRSGIEAALLRWQRSPDADADALGQARDRLDRLKPSLAGTGPAEAWGFKANGSLLIFGRREAHRCLYGWALASTQHLLGEERKADATLAGVEGDCRGGRADVKLVICDRLRQAAGTGRSRAVATGRWLGCEPVAT